MATHGGEADREMAARAIRTLQGKGTSTEDADRAMARVSAAGVIQRALGGLSGQDVRMVLRHVAAQLGVRIT
jgi:hypothetical protein